MDTSSVKVLRAPRDGGPAAWVSVYAHYYLIWMSGSWCGEVYEGPDGLAVWWDTVPDASFHATDDGRYVRTDGVVLPVEHRLCPRPHDTPAGAVEFLRAEAARQVAIHGAPLAGHRLLSPDGNAVRLEAAKAQQQQRRDLAARLFGVELSIFGRGLLFHRVSRYLMKERTA